MVSPAKKPRRLKVWVAANLAGLPLFLWSASRFWIEPELAFVPGASGGAAFGWIIWAAPIFVLFALANMSWLVFSLVMLSRSRNWRSPAIALTLLVLWFCAYAFDHVHHGM